MHWKVACRCTPSTARCPWSGTCRPLSPITAAANAGHVGVNGDIPDVSQLRIPVQYLANLLTAGDTGPVVRALERMLAMRAYQRATSMWTATPEPGRAAAGGPVDGRGGR